MKHIFKAATLILISFILISTPLTGCAVGAFPASGSFSHMAAYRFVNGLWFNGQAFEKKTMYAVNGLLREKYEGKVDDTFDLAGKFIIPPFAEAHTHHFMEGIDNKAQINTYLTQGIFYAKNPNSLQKLTDPVRPLFNKETSVDVIFSNGGLTASGGHPIQIYDYLAEKGHLPGWSKEAMKNQAYFVINTEEDLEAQWKLIKAGRPDFIKTYLEYSEEYEARKDDPKYYGQRGLDPALLPKIVSKAHQDKLRVSVHVNTAADFRAAITAGADEIAHLPLARISEADARLAALRNTVVVTTTLSHRKTDHVTGLDDVHRHNLQLLHKAGVQLAIGTDDNNRTVRDEAENIFRLKIFDNLTLLKLWTQSTPQAIFPGRKIGLLRDSYEASFLGLDQNPLDDFMNVRKISFRFKQGHLIEVDKASVEQPKRTGKSPSHP